MGGEEGEGENEGFVGGAGAKEFEGVVFVFLGDVDECSVGLFLPVGRLIGAAEIEFLLRELAVVPLADVADEVAVLAQDAGIGFVPRGLEHGEGRVAVA